MDQAPIVVPRGFKGFWAAIIWTRMGVGFGLFGDGNEMVRNRNNMGMKEKGIGRIW